MNRTRPSGAAELGSRVLSGWAILAISLFIGSQIALGDVRPPVKITMPRDMVQANSAVEYNGIFEIHVGEAGRLSDFSIAGNGWLLLSAEFPAAGARVSAGVIRVPFRAIPADAEQPIRLSFRYEGRQVRRAFRIGPEQYARAAAPRVARRVGDAGTPRPTGPSDVGPAADPPGGGAPRGDAIPLHFFGRFVYQRQDGIWVGADSIGVWVYDDDGLSTDSITDEVIWSGTTDVNGYFDSGIVMWDDCDGLGCDEPDIYVHFECDTAIAQVQTSDIAEVDYYWRTMDNIIEDFTGVDVNFGTLAPGDPAEYAAVHIWNSIIRAHRYILDRSGIDLPIVDVQWPESDDGAYYNTFYEEIHIGPDRTWLEGTHSHEYGHHFLENRADPPASDYCNGYCDGDTGGCNFDPDCPNEGHCSWCPENEFDAYNEGWADWLGDAIPRDYPNRYVFDDSTPYTALGPKNYETPDSCCVAAPFAPLVTEGFVAALLRDIEDAEQDDHDSDGIMDVLCLGPEEILFIADAYEPQTVLAFISAFRIQYPQHSARLWATAFNVGGEAYSGPATDTEPPGVVPFCASPSHPIGTGGALPCITLEFDAAPDNGTGASQYSFQIAPTAAGLLPDTNAEPVRGTDSCLLSTTVVVTDLGTYYVSIRAGDNADNWSSSFATFGPFEVIDCNGSGALDVCDIRCCLETCDAGPPGTCSISGAICPDGSCGTSSDCNGNFQPDECDIAQGLSEDCNEDGIPDECQIATLKHWTGDNSMHPTWWESGPNWAEGQAPAFGNDVCIPAGEPTPLLRRDPFTVGTLACRQDLSMAQAAGFPNVVLTMQRPSFIEGNLSISSGTVQVDNALEISGTLSWSGGLIRGAGQTTVTGAHLVSGLVALQNHRLNLHCDTLVTSGGFAGGGNTGFTIQNFPGYTYTQVDGIVHQANGALFINDGTILKPSGSGELRLDSPVHNHGEIRANAGTIRFGSGLTSSGSIVGLPGTTLLFNGSQDLESGSSVVGDRIVFNTSAAPNSRHVRGTYDAGYGTTIQSSANVTFHPEAHIIDYGDNLVVSSVGHFDAVVGSTIHFASMDISGSAYFTSGDPIVTGTLALGTIFGANKNITVNGLLTWNNAGSFLDSGVINANGGLLVAAGSSVKNLQCVLNNGGTAAVQGSFDVLAGGAVNNLATGVWDMQVDGTLITSSNLVFDNAGLLLKSAGAGTTTIGTGNPANRPTVNNHGTVEVRLGTLAFSWARFTQTGGQVLLNGGNLSMTGSPAMPLQLNGGLLKGTGTVSAVVSNTAAAVEPGNSAGTLNITGSYNQSAGGALRVEIGGTGAGQFDVLNVSGAATLAGELNVQTIGGFSPVTGNTFVILNAGSISGTFGLLSGAAGFSVSYTPTQVILTATAPQLPGDLDGDCDVDLADLAVMLSNFGTTSGATHAMGDVDGDGDVDLADLAALLGGFGTSC
jgi:hypothetical protein